KTIQEPQVKMLEAVKLQAFLVRRQPAKESDINVIIVARDIDKAMMNGIVFLGPNVRAAAQEIEAQGQQLVDPLSTKIRFVPRVVLNVEPHGRHGQAQRNRRGQSQPPRPYQEHQEEVGAREPGENQGPF